MKVTWNAQQRSDSRVTLADALSVHLSHTICGMALAAGVAVGCPSLLPWLLPILIGLVCSVPLSMLLGSVRVGRALAERGLLLIPEEVQLPPVLQLQHDALARGADADRSDAATQSQPAADPFVTVLSDPHRYGLHVGIVRTTDGVAAMSAEDYAAVRRQVAAGGAASVPAALRRSTLSDVGALQNLHVLLRSR
jgi:membrane glycosyltransferase